jgi:hypothetical protein
MSIESLTAEIETARDEFAELNQVRWEHNVSGQWLRVFPTVAHESRLVELALVIERLHNFRGWLFAKNFADEP